MKTNKEVIDKLQDYFMKQDIKLVCRALAGTMIDINRIMNIEYLPQEEYLLLIARLMANNTQLMKFINDGPQGNFNLHNIESCE